ncbi:MAG TPA: fibronectin type III domain-containing protein, partial [Chryseosolibacter sp.]
MKKTLFLFLLLFETATRAQVFPVQVNTQLVPPYSPYLSDYTAGGAQNLMVQIRTNDITLANYPCRLRITIEGTGITLKTKPHFIPQPLTLQGGGVPEIFYGEDLAEYFSPEALDFSGFSRSEFEKSARLPEGVYRFSVEVLDYHRGTVVSNKGSAVAWIVLNDPPLLNLPADHAKVQITDPTNILFTWTPRHTGSPNAAFTTEYVFRLVEMPPAIRDPNDALLSQSPLYEMTTTQSETLYGLGEPALLPGRSYAWQVTAHDTGGKDLFKNGGRSEVFVFTFGEVLPPPENLLLRWTKPTTLAIRWNKVPGTGEEVKYRLTYRPRKRTANDDHQWYETRTKFTEKTLYDLQPDTEYEVKVRTEKTAQESEYTETEIFRTLPLTAEVFTCKPNAPPPPVPENTAPVFPLSINDTIHAGGFSVLVRDVMEVKGKYFGSGLAIVPWFNSAKVRVTFENIAVNDRFWLTGGTIKSVWNAGSKFLQDVERPLEPGTAPKAGDVDITIVAADTLITVEGAAIANVSRDEQENIVVTTTDGKEQVLAKGESYAVTDQLGNGYIIDKQGNIAKTTATEARAAAARANRDYELTFTFSRGEGRFGFDEKKLEVLSRYYQQLPDGTYASWKSLSTSHPDRFDGHLTSGNADPMRIRFKSGPTQYIPLSSAHGNFTLNLQGLAAGMEQELLALYSPTDTIPEKVLGKVNLVTYNLLRYNLVIVPVNGAVIPGGLSADELSVRLNAIYGQAVVEWRVAVDGRLEVPLGETFDEGETGMFSNYSGDMKKVIDAYGRMESHTHYLFLIDRPRDPASLGYMPRSRPAGFIFIEPHRGNADEFIKTIAHELGHGAFNLKHTFSEYALPPATTDNLMDYSNGTFLNKYQWDHIHEPQTVLGLFDESGEIASVELKEEQLYQWWTRLAPYEKAGEILKKHLEESQIFKEVGLICDSEKCRITADLDIGGDINYTMEVTFLSTMSPDDLLYTLAFEYHIDLWVSFKVKAEDVWDDLYYWWRKQNDDLAQHKGWQVATINLIADVVTAPTLVPAVEGWITGKHWRDGHTLRGWEQALAVLDFLVAEEMAKGCITNFI